MKPYTYLIGWTKHNLWYYGVQFGENSDPNNLWNTYYTSSKKVQMLREDIGEPDIIQIRKQFSSPEEAREWETKVIRRLHAVNSDKWLNQTDNTENFYWQGKRAPRTKDHREKISAAHLGKKISKEHARKLHEGRRKSTNSKEHIEAYRKVNLGSKRSAESKQKMRDAKLKNPNTRQNAKIAGIKSAEKRKNDFDYKKRQSERMKLWWTERKAKEGLVNGD